ncbi:inorganic phosphate transporter [Halarsenatibacter silvermanii]|uniref:Inorganic phosphate transporter, PiT family n=1 Tax=Halarsenatibacter silvermanii TaxID=321763 RepID=A0A1G9LU11_9FIRM|nr:inorganic phosphate transporter [Halarsenatibacter silvermanii]SDL65592.1 inorganic phosphate transporter, PiT family [Halarsenatibacter silvermanii]
MWYLLSGIYLGGTLGANDAANIFGTAVYTRVVKFQTAILLTTIFVILGAGLEGAGGMETYGRLADQTLLTAFISSLAAAVTVTGMTYLELPVSTSQAVVGSIIGGNILAGDVDFTPLIPIVAAWITTPIGAMIIAYLLYRIYGVFIEARINNMQRFEYFVRIGLIVAGIYGAYSLGANNVANVIGVYVEAGMFEPQIGGVIGGMAIGIGCAYSRGVMRTVGERITKLTPLTALITVLAHSITLYIYARIGIPVSSSQAIVGGVIGVGFVKGTNMLDWETTRNIFLAWILTPTIGLIAGILLHLSATTLVG